MAKFYENLRMCLLILLLLVGGMAMAQNKTVRGKVTSSDDGSALPGVNIIEKGTSSGTVTDAQGSYSLMVKDGATLVFSFIGYTTQEVAIESRSTIDVALVTDVTSLSEVVVVGYGQQEKKDLTGSVMAISTKDFNKGIISSPQDMLIGKIAGVQVTTNDGAPGAGSTIRIRGSASIGGSQDPLIVIDGFPVDNSGPTGSTTAITGLSNPLATINPNDIETFTVLKDAAATAIYGLRASNGVIIITTKKGKEGKPQISYNANVSLSSPMRYVKVLSGDEMRATGSQLLADGYPGITADALKKLGTANTDWQKEIFRTAVSHDHNLSVSGAYKSLPYRVSYGYTDQEGTLKTTNFVRNSLNINLTPTFLDGDLKVTASMKGSYTQQSFGNTGAVGAAVSFDPTQTVYNGSSRWGGYYAWLGPSTATVTDPVLTLATSNPVALLQQTDNRSNIYRGLGNIQLDYRLRFLPALKLTLNAGMDYSSSKGHNNAPDNAAFTYPNIGQRINYTGISKSSLLDLYANYTKNVGKSKLDITGGYSYQHFERDGSNFSRNGDGTLLLYNSVDAEGNAIPRKYISNPNYLLSFFGRMNYSFDDKYLVSLSLRRDGTSRFSEHWGTFPAAAVGWKINKEAFMSNVKLITDLKLRASYGITGNQDIANVPYPYLSTYQLSSSTSQYMFGGIPTNTYRPQPYDSKLKWETTAQTDIGLDFGLANKLTGTIDFYQKNTRDLINSIPVAAGSNFSNFLTTNVGNLVNKGYEITLRYTAVKSDKVEWNIGMNFTHNENKVTKLLKTDNPSDPGVSTGGIGLGKFIQNIQVGYPINTFLVYQQVYNSKGKPVEGLYVDRSGQGGVVTASENNKYHFHKPQPDYLIGINSRLNYKNWDMSISGRLSIGNYVYNSIAASANYSNFYYSTGYFNNLPKYVNDTKFGSLQSYSDYYVQNASFFKMDNISMGYNFSEFFTNKLKARLSLTVQNAFFITKYKGVDPEVNGGIDNNLYPRSRVFMVGFSLNY